MKKHPSKRDENEDAAEVVRQSTAAHDELPKGVEAAWSAWSARIQAVDERTRTLLRAAFEAGAAAMDREPVAARLGKLGASKGGDARAASLTKKRRAEIAKRAARARWRGRTPPG